MNSFLFSVLEFRGVEVSETNFHSAIYRLYQPPTQLKLCKRLFILGRIFCKCSGSEKSRFKRRQKTECSMAVVSRRRSVKSARIAARAFALFSWTGLLLIPPPLLQKCPEPVAAATLPVELQKLVEVSAQEYPTALLVQQSDQTRLSHSLDKVLLCVCELALLDSEPLICVAGDRMGSVERHLTSERCVRTTGPAPLLSSFAQLLCSDIR